MTEQRTAKRTKVDLEVSVWLEVGGEDDAIEIPAMVEIDSGTIWVYVNAEEIRGEIAALLNAPSGVSDFGLGLHGLMVSQHYRMAWVSARDRARRLRAQIQGAAR